MKAQLSQHSQEFGAKVTKQGVGLGPFLGMAGAGKVSIQSQPNSEILALSEDVTVML